MRNCFPLQVELFSNEVFFFPAMNVFGPTMKYGILLTLDMIKEWLTDNGWMNE